MEIRINLILPWPSQESVVEVIDGKSWMASSIITRESVPSVGSLVAIESVLPDYVVNAAGPFVVKSCHFDFGPDSEDHHVDPISEANLTLVGVLTNRLEGTVSVEGTQAVHHALVQDGWVTTARPEDPDATWTELLRKLRDHGWGNDTQAEGSRVDLCLPEHESLVFGPAPHPLTKSPSAAWGKHSW